MDPVGALRPIDTRHTRVKPGHDEQKPVAQINPIAKNKRPAFAGRQD
jgi:hypothetical protein